MEEEIDYDERVDFNREQFEKMGIIEAQRPENSEASLEPVQPEGPSESQYEVVAKTVATTNT